ncbi:MAG TPA: DinB family protein [Vicinamibacterales bacterium]|nr:DinB family protein [Vicinamibacterales bacterium]
MDKKERERLVGLYRDGYRAVVEALHGADEAQLAAKPAPGKWSARDIVHHLADSEMTAAVRLRLLLAVDRPVIQGYDQDAFSARLHYDRPHESSLEAFRYARDCTAQLLERLSEDEWLREGTHTEAGSFGVTKWLEVYGTHAHSHARQIVEALDRAKKNQ